MTFSYTAPGTTDKDTVRFLLQDTTAENAMFSDEEIQFAIGKHLQAQGSCEYVAATLADTAAGRYAREASYSADGVSISLSQVAGQMRDLAASLRSQHANLLAGGAAPDVGGVTPGERVPPGMKGFSFGTGMHDFHEAGSQDYGDRDLGPEYDPHRNPGL